jgi:AAA family ATP:ADP antiporter
MLLSVDNPLFSLFSDNKLLDLYPKHHVFYMMGGAYGVAFTVMGLLLMHPSIGLPNTNSDPSRVLGWISYCTIESFGSMVVQCYWALVNASVDVHFAKKHFGTIIAGAQIGSILGPSLATQADTLGVPTLYLFGSVVMFFMVAAMYGYIDRFGVSEEAAESSGSSSKKTGKSEEGIMEGFNLFYSHDYVKGIFAISSFSMIQVTVIDYMMKVLAKERYETMYPNDPQAALRGFASFMGYFGQTTNTISFLFSFFGTSVIIKHLGFSYTLLAYPIILLVCTVFVWMMPNIWVVFSVMMVIKGMSYALNNPAKEILYQRTSAAIKFKCKSWIDTFGQRSAKATGSIITNQFATSIVNLTNYGSAAGLLIILWLLYISDWMGKEFERLTVADEKVGEEPAVAAVKMEELSQTQNDDEDTSCGLDEEGQTYSDLPDAASTAASESKSPSSNGKSNSTGKGSFSV